MPVYVPSRKKSVKVRAVDKHVIGKRRIFLPRQYWGFKKTKIEVVEKALAFGIREHVSELCKQGSPVVVDWGCGSGISVAAIAKTNPKAKVIGFSKDSYRKWFSLIHGTKKTRPNPNLRFIHAEAADFVKYFKDGTIDFMYSSLGLNYVEKLGPYIQSISTKLKVGGIIITDIITRDEHFQEFLRKAPKITKGEETVHTTLGNRPWQYNLNTYTYSYPGFEIKTYAERSTIQIKRTK